MPDILPALNMHSTFTASVGGSPRVGTVLIFLGLVALTSHASMASDWPMHRGGPQLRGVAPGPALVAPRIMWTRKVGTVVTGSVAISQGTVYVGTNDGKVVALKAASGKPRWEFITEGGIEATPCVVDDTVYVGSSDGFLYALRARSGDLIWKVKTGDKILGGANWAQNPEGDGKLILFGSYDGSLYCIDAETGSQQWRFLTDNYINGTPAVTKRGNVVFGGCDASIYVLALSDGSVVREIATEAYIAASVAVSGKLGFIGNYNNEVLALDLETGTVQWKYQESTFPFFSSAGLTDTWVIIGSRDRQLHCLDRKTGQLEWAFPARGKIDSSPVLAGEIAVFGADDGRLYGVDIANGEKAWSYEIGAPITASPAIADDLLIVGAEDGVIYAFKVR